MLRVCLTGGLASGKSVIARELEKLGCHVVKADVLGHQALMPDGEAYAGVVREFGGAILNQDGAIDRKRLSTIVFEDPDRLKVLNSIVHPAVARLSKSRFDAFEREDPTGILIYEAAILIEMGGFRNFDKLIVASCPEEVQIERAMTRDQSTREAAIARIRRQLPMSEKVRHADFVINTGGTVEQTIAQTRNVFEELSKSHCKKSTQP